ncbi:GIY-YIG nuclease family protein [Streptomyces sp. NPDC020996]|uniref:GIY-YIG nuclease family protein n=1 Tax=Streptomyces sp. NPDC020996 TaxID=3154791 RepID=UPI0033C23DE4
MNQRTGTPPDQTTSHDEAEAERTALYRCFDADEDLLYVGITKDPAQRWEQHRNKPRWRDVAVRVVEWYDNRAAAESAERKAIQNEGPRYNVQHNRRPAAPAVLEALAAPKRSHRTLADLYPDGISDAQARRIVTLLNLPQQIREREARS